MIKVDKLLIKASNFHFIAQSYPQSIDSSKQILYSYTFIHDRVFSFPVIIFPENNS